MKYVVHSYRFAEFLYEGNEVFSREWEEIKEVITSISEPAVIEEFESGGRDAKSISEAVNHLIKKELVNRGWNAESNIFADADYTGRKNSGTWRLDFAKENLSVEVAFNHGSDVLWNLMKPTLASELNHVEKAIQTRGGVIITATKAMRKACGFDGAIGTFEKYVEYLKPLSQKLTTPLLIVGLEAPDTFCLDVEKSQKGGKHGVVRRRAIEANGSYWCPECGQEVTSDMDACSCGRRLAFLWPDPSGGLGCTTDYSSKD